MMRTRRASRVWARAFFAVVWCVSLIAVAVAQDPNDGKQIVSIDVRGNKSIGPETIISKIKTQVGTEFRQQIMNDDLKRLYATDYFLDVSIDAKPAVGGVALTIIVEEKPVIDKIKFVGNRVFHSTKLRTTIRSKEGEVLSHAVLTQDVVEVRKLYELKGYQQVEVRYEIAADPDTNRAIVTITVDEKTKVKVAKITVKGNEHIKAGEILKVMTTKQAWWFIVAGTFQDDIFKEDLDKIKALYEDKGYLDAEVTPGIEYSTTGERMYITLNVVEGPQYFTGAIVFKGSLVYPEAEVRKRLKMPTKKPLSPRGLREDVFGLRQFYQERGYMNVDIDVARTLNEATRTVDLVYTIDAKEVVYVGKINIKGNTKTKDIVVRRELRIYPGDRYDGKKITKSKERLYNLGFFEDIYLDPEPTDKENVQDLQVSVKEMKTGEFAFGGGYSSIDSLMGFVQITQRNFDIMNMPTFMGAGQNLTLRADVGFVRQNYYCGWTDPWFLGYPFALGLEGYHTTHAKAEKVGYGYEEERSGGALRLGKEITDELSANAGYRLERVTISNVADTASQDLRNETGANWISKGSIGAVYDTRDNIYVPTSGIVVNANFDDAGGVFGGDKDFIKGMGGVTVYQSFLEKRFVLELKGRGGLASAYGSSDEVPIYERFFTGGANTIRGYRERAVSPRDQGSNDPIGGEAMVVGNAEVTFPLFEKILKGAVFFDTGNTWRRVDEFMSGGIRYGTGVGIRVKTPIGPMQLDWGYPLSDNYGEPKEGQFYFNVSQGF